MTLYDQLHPQIEAARQNVIATAEEFDRRRRIMEEASSETIGTAREATAAERDLMRAILQHAPPPIYTSHYGLPLRPPAAEPKAKTIPLPGKRKLILD